MASNASETILVVEGDPGVAGLEQVRLEKSGYRVLTALTAEEGLEKLAEGNVSLIVLDQQLKSGKSGLDFFNEAKAKGHAIPAILVTAASDEKLLVEAIRAGVRDFVPKTESFLNHLEPIVTHVLDQTRTERELAESRLIAREHEARRRELEDEISRRNRVEEALRNAERNLRLMVESVKDFAIFTVDPEGRIVTWNSGAEQVFGYTEEEILGHHLAILFTPEDRAANVPQAEVAAAAAKGRASDERWHLRQDGSRFFASGVLAPILDEGKQLRGFTKIARDITAYKEAVEERTRLLAELEAERVLLKQANERKDQFLAVLAHELRNPLAPIANAVQIMKVEGLGGPNFRWSVEVIESQIKQMTRLIDDLLDVSRITRGKVHLQKQPVSLNEVVDLAIQATRPLIEECGHHLTVDLPPLPVILQADVARLAQVFSNLLNNAAKYTDPGGEILLAAQVIGREVEIRVRDTGIGIAPQQLPNIFNMFMQADQAISRARGGLGIGLTLVRSLVEQHEGRVFARSSGRGQGTEVVVRLPYDSAVGQTRPSSAARSDEVLGP
jgi:PAS domain S-box-containing protein